MGAVSVANMVQGIAGHLRSVEADVTFSSSYTTGGDSIAPRSLGLSQIDDVVVLGYVTHLSSTSGGKLTSVVGLQPVLAGTVASPLLVAYINGAQVANATNLSTLGAVRMEFRGH